MFIPGAAVVFGIIGWWTYAGLQGKRDAPVVRFARMLSDNDDDVVGMAKALVADRSKALSSPDFIEAVFEELQPEDTSDLEALVTFAQGVSHGRSSLAQRFVIFDWKDGDTRVTDVLDNMLRAAGATPPTTTERDAILDETRKMGEKYTSLPILIVRYHRYFEAGDLQLLHIHLNWDAYPLVAVASKTAHCWNDVAVPADMARPGHSYRVEPAFRQAEEFINDYVPKMRTLVSEEVALRNFPASACLPMKDIWRRIIPFGNS